MNPSDSPDDTALTRLLRASRPLAGLPPRFQEGVWRRIKGAELPSTSPTQTWAEALAARWLKPRLAFAGLAILILAGAAMGTLAGMANTRHDARIRYVSVVAHPLR